LTTRNFWPFVFRRKVAKRKLKAKNNSPDSQEPTFHVWLRLSDVKPRWVNSWFQLFGCGQRLCCVLFFFASRLFVVNKRVTVYGAHLAISPCLQRLEEPA